MFVMVDGAILPTCSVRHRHVTEPRFGGAFFGARPGWLRLLMRNIMTFGALSLGRKTGSEGSAVEYRLHLLSATGDVVTIVTFESDGDADAIRHAHCQADGRAMELWCFNRLVLRKAAALRPQSP